LNRRRIRHFHDLKKGIHDNVYLQRAYDKYGKDAFSFEILELVEDDNIRTQREQYHLNQLSAEDYNLSRIANSSIGNKSRTGQKASQEEIQKRVEQVTKSVCQIDINTCTIIRIWPSAVIASQELNINKNSIGAVCRKQRKVAAGYYWIFDNDNKIGEVIDIDYRYIDAKFIKVIQLDNNDEIIKFWNSMEEASNTLGIKCWRINRVCMGQQVLAGKYKWKYYKDYINEQL
jgi:hypothetical protein